MSCVKTLYEIERCAQIPRGAPSMTSNERNECDGCGFYYTGPSKKGPSIKGGRKYRKKSKKYRKKSKKHHKKSKKSRRKRR